MCPDGYLYTVSLRGLSMVNSQFVVCDYNNWFVIDGHTYTVESGDYTATSLVAALNALTTGVCYFGFDSVSMKVTVTGGLMIMSGPLFNEILDIADCTAYTATSYRTVRLYGTQSVFVDISLPGQNITLRKGDMSSTTICRVPCTAAPLQCLHYENPITCGNLIHDPSVFAFTISLTDDKGRPLLCTTPYEMSLEFAPVFQNRYGLQSERPTALSNFPFPSK